MIDRCDEWIISFLCLSLFHNGLDGDGLADDQVKGLIDRLKIERKRRAGDDVGRHTNCMLTGGQLLGLTEMDW